MTIGRQQLADLELVLEAFNPPTKPVEIRIAVDTTHRLILSSC
jgi:hypothetical protein